MELNEALDYVQMRLLVEIDAYMRVKTDEDPSPSVANKNYRLKAKREFSKTWADIAQGLLAIIEYRERDVAEEIERIKERYE